MSRDPHVENNENEKKIHFTSLLDTLWEGLLAAGVSCTAIAIGIYILRHTEGRQQDWVQLSIPEFMHGRRKRNGEPYDAGLPIKHHATMEEGIKELGKAGFIFELDTGEKRGIKSYGMQNKWLERDPVKVAQMKTTPHYRLIQQNGKFYHAPEKPEKEKKPRQKLARSEEGKERQPRQKLTPTTSENSVIPRQKLAGYPAENSVVPSHGASPEEAPRAAYNTVDTSEIDTMIDTIAPSASLQAPAIKKNEKQEEEKQGYDSMSHPAPSSTSTPAEDTRAAVATSETAEEQAARVAAELEAVKQYKRDKEQHRIRTRLSTLRSEATRLHAQLDGSSPEARGRDTIEEKISLLESIVCRLETQGAVEIESEAWISAQQEEVTLQARYNALVAQERRPTWQQEG